MGGDWIEESVIYFICCSASRRQHQQQQQQHTVYTNKFGIVNSHCTGIVITRAQLAEIYTIALGGIQP